jgi:hypothetical protein
MKFAIYNYFDLVCSPPFQFNYIRCLTSNSNGCETLSNQHLLLLIHFLMAVSVSKTNYVKNETSSRHYAFSRCRDKLSLRTTRKCIL